MTSLKSCSTPPASPWKPKDRGMRPDLFQSSQLMRLTEGRDLRNPLAALGGAALSGLHRAEESNQRG